MIRLVGCLSLLAFSCYSHASAELIDFVPVEDIEFEDPTGDGFVFNSSSPDFSLTVREFK